MLFLSLSLVTGLGIGAYKKSRQRLEFSVQPYKMATLEDADKFIEQYSQININSFKIDELARLPGVGEKIAQRIVEYHQAHGAFKRKEELMRVEGIGEKKFEKVKDLIVLE